MAMKGPAVILIAAILALAFQPALASTMTSPQCSHATATDHHSIAAHSDMADPADCCIDSQQSGEHQCSNFCVISCASSAVADMPLGAVLIAAPSHSQHETDIKRPLLPFDAAFIPPPPRI